MSNCEWYQLLCKRQEQKKASMIASTDTIPNRIEDVNKQQLLYVAGVGIVTLAVVGFFTR